MKKRLTILLDAFTMGGAEHMVYELAKHMDVRQFDVNILCYMSRKGTLLEQQVEEKFPVTYLNQDGRIAPKTILQILRGIRATKPDVVHAHLGGAAFGAIWSVLCRGRLVITVHARPEKAFTKKIETLVRTALRFGKTKLVAVSAENETLVKEYFGLDEKKCACVNNGIDIQQFYRREHEGFTLINVARQDDNKNQAALIRCFAKLHEKEPDTRLLLLGDGPNHEALKQLAAELGVEDAVTFTGNVSNTEEYYAVSDIYVQCSFREALPLSVLEAMAAGLPIVSTNVGGLPDVVQDNGLLVPAGDEDALFAAMLKMYGQSQEQKDAASQASVRIVKAYSSEGMARAYEKIYNDV